MSDKKKKNPFVEGMISPAFVGESIAKHSTKTDIGAHSIFLGQVRNDIINGKEVKAIDYSAYKEMAEEKLHEINEDAFANFSLTCMHIHHSLGRVAAGEISLFVFASSKHREDAMEAVTYIVNRIKEEVPVWGKEVFEDETYVWKENTVRAEQ